MNHLHKHWKLTVGVLAALVVYLWFTRTRTIGTVDASGDGMEIDGKTWVRQ